MTIDPRIGLWFSLAAAAVSVLVLCGTEFTTIFGQVASDKILAALGIINAVANGINGVLHMIPSANTPADAQKFMFGPKP